MNLVKKLTRSMAKSIMVAGVMALSCTQPGSCTLVYETPNDPFFPSQWNLSAMRVTAAWPFSRGHALIGIIDNSVPNDGIAELAGKVIHRSVGAAAPSVDSDTGTGLATTAVARVSNGTATAGIAPDATIVHYRTDLLPRATRAERIIAALDMARQDGVKIVVLRLPDQGGDTRNGFIFEYFSHQDYIAVNDAIRAFHDQNGGLVFMPAGDHSREDRVTQLFPHLIVVSSSDANGGQAFTTNTGSSVWFAAPGQFIPCSDSAGRVQNAVGTSYAAVSCAAVAALILAQNPNLTNTQIEQLMVQTAQRTSAATRTNAAGYGIPDAQAAAARVWASLPLRFANTRQVDQSNLRRNTTVVNRAQR